MADEGRRDTRHLPRFLRRARAQDRPLGLARALRPRPLGAADDGRHAAVQALLPRPRATAGAAPRRRAEVLPHDRHRGGRQHRPPPDLLRDARQLELRRLLQGRVDPLGLAACDRGLRHGPGEDLGDGLRRRRGARPRPRRGGDRDLEGRRHARGADRPARSRGQLLAGRPVRPLRPLLGALPRPRRGLRRRRAAAGRRHRPLPRVLEPRLHDLRPLARRRPQRAADAQHRHRHGARPDGGDPAGRAVGLRDRPGPAADRPGRGAQRPLLRRGRRGDAGDADRRRPLARRRLPDRRRRRPLERGPRLHPAADHAAGDPAGPHARARGALARPLRRAHDRDHGRGLSRAGLRAGDDRPLGRRRGGELRPHAGARHGAARAPGRRGEAVGHLVDRRRRRVQAARHLRLPLRPDQGAARRAGALGRRRRLRGADGGAAPARPRRRRHRARLRGPPREGARLRRRGAADPLRRLRDAARDDRPGGGRRRRRAGAGQARGQPLLRRGRRPGRRLGRAALGRC